VPVTRRRLELFRRFSVCGRFSMQKGEFMDVKKGGEPSKGFAKEPDGRRK
jgi:hypothetical protein